MRTRTIKEGGAKLVVPAQPRTHDVFFNPEMELCRDVTSLAVGAFQKRARRKLAVCDALAGTGARGVRYAAENPGIARVDFVDLNPIACGLIRRNAALNKLHPWKVYCTDFRIFASEGRGYDWLELDPFGSPAPYLHDGMFLLRDRSAISVTATDTAVLCGARAAACLKNYRAVPVNNECCHETGVRILLATIAAHAAEFNCGIIPLFSLSRAHYFKTVVEIGQGAEAAGQSMAELGWALFCPACGHRFIIKGLAVPLPASCEECGTKLKIAGPLWVGPLWDRRFVKSMAALNEKRDYGQKKAIEKLLTTIYGEAALGPLFFDVHRLCSQLKATPPRLDDLVAGLRKKGFKAARTHFRENSIRTNARAADLAKLIRLRS